MITADEIVRMVDVALGITIRARLESLEAVVRSDMAATGPEDEQALDEPPGLDSAWHRCSIEQIVEMDREQLERWRRATLCDVRQVLDVRLGELPMHYFERERV